MPPARPVIDSAAFARERGRIEGKVAVAGLSRLADVLAGGDGELVYTARGAEGGNGQLLLDLAIGGRLMLRCQRCLQPISFEVALDCRFRLVESGQTWPDDELVDDSYDAVAAERELDLVALVEQEVMLSLPLAPRHDDCALPESPELGQKVSPFAALAEIKRGLH